MRTFKTIFITGTDTGVGKTVTMKVLDALFKAKGLSVGLLKPVQCAGRDAQILNAVNPYFAPEPLSPHLALRRAKIRFKKQRVLDAATKLRQEHQIVLVEGAGGLMVPITETYYNIDLIQDLKAQVIIVSRLGLGTINHTLLTIRELQHRRIKIKGIIFCQNKPLLKTLPEKTNPQEIARLSGVPVLGTIPYLKSLTPKNILRQCRHLNI